MNTLNTTEQQIGNKKTLSPYNLMLFYTNWNLLELIEQY